MVSFLKEKMRWVTNKEQMIRFKALKNEKTILKKGRKK